MKFLVTTPNPAYAGKTAGVLFNEGRALVDSALPPSTGKPIEHVVIELQEFGYNVEPLDDDAKEFMFGKPKEPTKTKKE